MVKHIQDPKTGKFAGSIGDGKRKVPTVAVTKTRANPSTKIMQSDVKANPFFEGTPDWFPGYAKTIAEYVTHQEQRRDPSSRYKKIPGELAQHFIDTECQIETIHNVEEKVSAYSYVNSYDNVESEVDCSTSANVTCACGKFKNYHASVDSTLENTMSSAFQWIKNREEHNAEKL